MICNLYDQLFPLAAEASKQPAMKEEGCSYKDGHHKIGEEFNDGCEAVCYCEEAGHISCKPRLDAFLRFPYSRIAHCIISG